MASAKWRPFCLGLNVLIEWDFWQAWSMEFNQWNCQYFTADIYLLVLSVRVVSDN